MTNKTVTFKDYFLAEAAKDYHYKVKLAVNDLSSEQKDALENALGKFELRNMGDFSNSPIQQHPLDFPNVHNTKVYVAEFTLGYPVTVQELRVYLSDKVGINQQEIAVYNADDPRNRYTDEALAQKEIDRSDYVPALGSDYPVEEKPEYGKEYNAKFLKELDDARADREVDIRHNPLMPDMKRDTVGVSPHDVGEQGGDSTLGGKKGPRPPKARKNYSG